MKLRLYGSMREGHGTLRVTREPSDPKFYGAKRNKADSAFLYHVRNELQKRGVDAVKMLMWKDGHLVSETEHYLRSRKYRGALNWWHAWFPYHAIRQAARDFNDGEVNLDFEASSSIVFNEIANKVNGGADHW